jgi:hypothetical protein
MDVASFDVANLIYAAIGCIMVLLGEVALVVWFMGEVEPS